MRTGKYILSVVLITMAILALGFFLWSGGTSSFSDDSFCIVEGGWSRGADDAPVTIEVFSNFGCGSCVEHQSVLLEVMGVHQGYVRMVYHHLAFSDYSRVVAQGLEAAGEQGKFWEMHDKLVEHRPSYDGCVEELGACAAELGLDVDRFNQALASGRFAPRVDIEKEMAKEAGIAAAAVFINGEKIDIYPFTLESLCLIIEEKLQELGITGGSCQCQPAESSG